MIAIDLFAGLGGFTEAASSVGVRVAWAANHWKAAVDIHAANHPKTSHVCQDLHQADWESVPKMDLLLASPACQGHARARGKERPHHDACRSTAWAVVSCAEFHRPAAVVVENVPEFLKWTLFPAWAAAMKSLGGRRFLWFLAHRFRRQIQDREVVREAHRRHQFTDYTAIGRKPGDASTLPGTPRSAGEAVELGRPQRKEFFDGDAKFVRDCMLGLPKDGAGHIKSSTLSRPSIHHFGFGGGL